MGDRAGSIPVIRILYPDSPGWVFLDFTFWGS